MTSTSILNTVAVALANFSLAATTRVEKLAFREIDDIMHLVPAGDSKAIPSIVVPINGQDILFVPRGKKTMLALPITNEILTDSSYIADEMVLIDTKQQLISLVSTSFEGPMLSLDLGSSTETILSTDFLVWSAAIMAGDLIELMPMRIGSRQRSFKLAPTLPAARYALGSHQYSAESFVQFVASQKVWSFNLESAIAKYRKISKGSREREAVTA